MEEKNISEEELLMEEQVNLMLEELLNKEVPVPYQEDDSNELKFKCVKIGEIIDRDKDIWFSNKKKKPIITEEGFKKLADATGAEFPDYRIIEKQSDYPNFQSGQVWIEADVVFPNGEKNSDYGVANSLNCSDYISKAHMPIMALKRAKSRAFFKSKTINLPAFDESEVRNDIINEIARLKERIDELEKQNESTQKKFEKLFNCVKESVKYGNKLIWEENELNRLNGWLKSANNIQQYAILTRIRYLNKINGNQPHTK